MINPIIHFWHSPLLRRSPRGSTLIEVLVAMGLSAILLPALATAVITSREGRAQDQQRLQATALQRETIEALRSVRAAGWSNIATNGTYHPTINAGNWTLASGAETANGFTRSIVISDAQRTNALSSIVTSGGSVDPSTKKATVTIGWDTPLPTTVTTDLYLQRYPANAAWTQTTQAQFDTDTKTNVTSANTAGGEVQLASMPGSTTWDSPSIIGSYDTAGTEDAYDVFVLDDYAYVADTTILRIVNIANPASPALVGSYTAGGTITGVHVVGSYAYLSTSNNSQELTVLNVGNPAAPTLTATRDLGDAANGNAIYVLGSYAYVGKVNSTKAGINEFYIVDISNPGSPSITGSLNIAGNINTIQVNGTMAYVSTSVDTAELTIINVANPASPSLAGVYNTAGTGDGLDVFAIGTTAYVATNTNSTGPELFIVNAANPASPTLIGSYNAAAAVFGVTVSGNYAFLATAVANQQFAVLNITTPASPALLSSISLGATSNDLVFAGDHVYIASQHNTQELIIIQGTTTASGYQTSGTLEASSFDAGANAGFNYLTFTATKPANTNIQLQIASNSNNSTWNYVGPDGTAGSFYTANGAIPLGQVSGRYIRYKATLTGNGSVTPVLQDVSVNYSP